MQLSGLPLFFFLALWLCGCGGGGASGFTALAAPPSANLDAAVLRDTVKDLFTQSGAKAMLVTVRQGENEVLSMALGESMTGVPARVEDHVRMGGISETYWGTIVMLLVERGVVHLDDPISKWLPDLLQADKVTVGMLLNNTAGYKDYVADERAVNDILTDPFRAFTRDELIAYAVASGQMNFPPGSASRYSHTEFTIMGKLIEKATGKSMEQLHQELIFEPLGLQETGYSKSAELPEPVLHVFSSDRGVYEDATFWNPSWTGDSGPLYSTIGEIARWVRVHGRGELLSPESFARLTARPAVASGSGPYFAGGFVVANGWFFQNPNFNGYSGAYGYLPGRDITIVVFSSVQPAPAPQVKAFDLFKQLVQTITPDQTITN